MTTKQKIPFKQAVDEGLGLLAEIITSHIITPDTHTAHFVLYLDQKQIKKHAELAANEIPPKDVLEYDPLFGFKYEVHYV
jgi:hypothetical protein